jgi:hypothetical protein
VGSTALLSGQHAQFFQCGLFFNVFSNAASAPGFELPELDLGPLLHFLFFPALRIHRVIAH